MRTPRVLVAVLLVSALAPGAQAKRARAISLKFPRIEVPPRTDREVCTFVRLPRKGPLDNGGFLIVNHGGDETFTSHHFLMWAYTGNAADQFPEHDEVKDGEACIDFGPPDSTQRVLIGGSQSRRSLQRLPSGLAQQIPTIDDHGRQIVGLILNTHWINGGDRKRSASVKVKLLPPAKGP